VLGAGCGHWEDINSWTVELPEVEKPPVEVPAPPPAGSPTKRILQLTDIHLDLRYAKVELGWPNARGGETARGGASSSSSWFPNPEDPTPHKWAVARWISWALNFW
jgi:hypothetical protein